MIPDLTLSPLAWAAIATWAGALACVLITTPLIGRIAWATGYLDHPEARKLHLSATPLLGGVALALAALVGWGLGTWSLALGFPARLAWWAAGACTAMALGLADDRFGMQPAPKLIGQFVAAILFLKGGVYPQVYFGPFWGQVISALWIVGLMNATNFLDNMDGIVGGMAAICGFAFAALLAAWGRPLEALIALGLAGASFGFLRYNFAPARIFLGDAGSLFVGYVLSALGLMAATSGPGLSGVMASLLVLGFPLFDTTFVVGVRLFEGRRIYVGGRDHTTHRLSRIAGGSASAALRVYAITAALAASGIFLGLQPGGRVAVPLLLVWGLLLAILGRHLARVPQL